MRFETVTRRIGEKVSELDWSYDFRQHFNNHCTSRERKDAICETAKERLRAIEKAISDGRKIMATNYGGCPRIGFHRVISVGMYDGWPYWRPVPSVQTEGTLGPEWHSFDSITDIFEV